MKNHEIKTIYLSFYFGFFGVIQTFQYIFIQFDSLQRFYEQALDQFHAVKSISLIPPNSASQKLNPTIPAPI